MERVRAKPANVTYFKKHEGISIMEITILPSSKIEFHGQYSSDDVTTVPSIVYKNVKLKDLANVSGAVCMFLYFFKLLLIVVVLN